MDALIRFILGHLAALFYFGLGGAVVLYSSLAKHMTFEGDVAIRPKERKRYKSTPEMRKYGVSLGLVPLLYGLYLLLFH